ncbi:hypothetical protein CR513_39165, partial [Mucuna pruriens]
MKRMFLEKLFLSSKTASIKKKLCSIRQHSGMMLMDKSMIDAASGEALMDKTPTIARNLISNMAGNTQQFGVRGFVTSKVVNKILKYAKFLKEVCTHERKKLNGDVEMERNVSAFIKSEQVSALIQPVMPKKYSDPGTLLSHAP